MPIDQHILIFLFTTLGASYGVMFGGGSFMILPLLFLLGIDPKVAIATNIAASVAQLITGAAIFSRHKKIHYEIVPMTTVFYLIGGIIGAFILIQIDAELIKKIVAVAIIFFALFGIFKYNHLIVGICRPGKLKSILAFPVLIITGAYKMVVTAGSGTLMTFILMYLFGLSLKCAIYTRQIITLPTTIVGAGILIYNGLVGWNLLIPLVIGKMAGAFVGSKLLMHAQRKKLGIIFTLVVIAIAIKTLIG